MNIKQLAEKYELKKDDFWQHKQSGSWILTHDACQKIANKANIQFGAPTVFRDDNSNVAFVGDAKRGNTVAWSTGEAGPKNCRMAYPFAMAEKRLKDRLTLKLINAYEYGIYSEVEADSFKKGSDK
jgi:hypothetical protein